MRKGITLNPRTVVVAEAQLEFSKTFLEIEKKYELTWGEMFQILAQKMDRLAQDLVQVERHPDDQTKSADEA